MLWGFMAIVPDAASWRDKSQRVTTLVRQAVVVSQTSCKVLAGALDLSESHLSRQFADGLNLGRLVNAGKPLWREIVKPLLLDVIGFTRDEILTIFGAETDAEREKKDAETERRISELERQLAEVLKRRPAPSEDSVTRVA